MSSRSATYGVPHVARSPRPAGAQRPSARAGPRRSRPAHTASSRTPSARGRREGRRQQRDHRVGRYGPGQRGPQPDALGEQRLPRREHHVVAQHEARARGPGPSDHERRHRARGGQQSAIDARTDPPGRRRSPLESRRYRLSRWRSRWRSRGRDGAGRVHAPGADRLGGLAGQQRVELRLHRGGRAAAGAGRRSVSCQRADGGAGGRRRAGDERADRGRAAGGALGRARPARAGRRGRARAGAGRRGRRARAARGAPVLVGPAAPARCRGRPCVLPVALTAFPVLGALSGVLQGRQRFGALALVMGLDTVLRVGGAIAGLLVGRSPTAALAGLAAGILLATVGRVRPVRTAAAGAPVRCAAARGGPRRLRHGRAGGAAQPRRDPGPQRAAGARVRACTRSARCSPRPRTGCRRRSRVLRAAAAGRPPAAARRCGRGVLAVVRDRRAGGAAAACCSAATYCRSSAAPDTAGSPSPLWLFALTGSLLAVAQLLLFSRIASGDVRSIARGLARGSAWRSWLVAWWLGGSVTAVAVRRRRRRRAARRWPASS